MTKSTHQCEAIIKRFQHVAKIPRYRNKWLSDKAWVEAINQHYPQLNVKKRNFNYAFSVVEPYSSSIDVFDLKYNKTGIFRRRVRKRGSGRLIAYHVADEDTNVECHKDNWRGWDSVHNNIIETRSDRSQVEGEGAEEQTNDTTTNRRSNNIRQSTLVLQETYFDSPEARHLFNAQENEHALDAINRQIETQTKLMG